MHRRSRVPLLALTILTFVASGQCADKYVVLHAFAGHPGEFPSSTLMFDKQGNLYGTTSYGSPSRRGAVFELTPKSGGGWIYSVLYRFQGGMDGDNPQGALIQDAAGNFYGTTQAGGGSTACLSGCGTVFELSPTSGGWIETVLYRFGGTSGASPQGSLVMDSTGNLYGTTVAGGSGTCLGGEGCGSVFELESTHGIWSEQVLYNFTGGVDGFFPHGKLLFDVSGNLYGTTIYSKNTGPGTVFVLTPTSNGWQEHVLHTFSGGTDGIYPVGDLTFDPAGNLYGTTEFGGGSTECDPDPGGCGTVFELTPSSSGWRERVIHKFQNEKDGQLIVAGLVVDAAGNLYGASSGGGPGGHGTAFQMTPGTGGHWTLTTLHSFRDGLGGGDPTETLVLDATGNLYGTALLDGRYGFGLVFEIEQ